jgi:hypothetical protein
MDIKPADSSPVLRWILRVTARLLCLGACLAAAAQDPTFESFKPREQHQMEWVEWHCSKLGGVKWVRVGPADSRFTVSEDGKVLRFQVPPDAPVGPQLVSVFHGAGASGGSAHKERIADRPLLVLPERGAAPAPPAVVAFCQVYITQAVQRMDGSVPLVADRDGMLRVFLRADRGNARRPAVRVRLRTAGAETLNQVIEPAGPGVPTVLDEDRLSSSWNLFLPGRLIRPGTTVQVEPVALPGFPEGEPRALDVRVVPPLRITFHPVRMEAAAGRPAGDVTEANLAVWVDALRRMLPVAEIDARLGAEFPTREKCLDPKSVEKLLVSLDETYCPESPAEDGRYHVGVFRVPPSGRNLGMAGGSTRELHFSSMICADALDTFSEFTAPQVLVHEFCHLQGRLHPEGTNLEDGVDRVDHEFPYPGGFIGVSGFDVAARAPRSPLLCHDLMTYQPPYWISDCTYLGVLEFLTLRSSSAAPHPGPGP